MSFESIKKIIPQVVSSRGISKPILTRQILEEVIIVLKTLWGEERAAYIRPISFADGILKLECRSAVAKQQLSLDRIRLLNEMNRRLGERKVYSIELRDTT